uniref:Kinesin motor domain-containing protein n=1 Tax=Heterorhabditis bacteriophora TaxID=37862 RepID=A0A1I7WCN2_HETBA
MSRLLSHRPGRLAVKRLVGEDCGAVVDVVVQPISSIALDSHNKYNDS